MPSFCCWRRTGGTASDSALPVRGTGAVPCFCGPVPELAEGPLSPKKLGGDPDSRPGLPGCSGPGGGPAVWGPTEKTRTREEQADRLAQAVEEGTELQLFEAAMVLDRMDREELNRLLDSLEAALGARIGRSGDRRRSLRGVELVHQLRRASQLNANSGQMAGWLCAGMFIKE